MKRVKKEMRVSFFDRNYPLALFLFALVATYFITKRHTIELAETFVNVLNSTITWTSVLLGFLGVLLGILFSLQNTEMVQILFKHATRNTLKRYFCEGLLSGIFLVLISMVLFIIEHHALFSLWVGTVLYSLASAYRIISLMMQILFSPKISLDGSENKTQVMDKESRELLAKRVLEKNKSE